MIRKRFEEGNIHRRRSNEERKRVRWEKGGIDGMSKKED